MSTATADTYWRVCAFICFILYLILFFVDIDTMQSAKERGDRAIVPDNIQLWLWPRLGKVLSEWAEKRSVLCLLIQ